MPLSSHTNRIGTGRCWYPVHAAVLIAPVAVEWFAEASPNVHTMIASCGARIELAIGEAGSIPSRAARSSATAAPTALGSCDAIVEVCGGIASGWLPNTLWRPPAIGSSLLAHSPSSTSSSGVCPGTWCARATKNAPER